MRVLFLFSRSRIPQVEKLERGEGHDNHFNGMFRIRKYGIETGFLDPEHVFPSPIARLWRRVFNIFWMQAPFFPWFFRYDVVFAGAAYGALLMKALLHLPRPKWVIYDANITGTIGAADTFRKKVFKYAVSKAEGIVALSEAERDSLRKMFPTHPERYEFFYEGVDTTYFKPLSVPEGDYILSVGLDPGRDFGTLIDAMRELPHIPIIIATKPERVASYDPLPPNVTAKLYAPEDMRDLYARARCVVIGLNTKDNNDSMGTYAVIEAMACGKAVIATKTKALASYIKDGETGIFVPPHDGDALKDAIVDLYTKENKRTDIGARARDFIVRNADADVYAQHLSDFFYRLCSSTATR